MFAMKQCRGATSTQTRGFLISVPFILSTC
jgi:hypothetical protein